MAAAIPVLTVETMQTELSQCGLSSIELEVFDSLPSTSEYLMAAARQSNSEKEPSELLDTKPVLCVTDWQTNGNGRRGKTWVTDRGNVTFSLLLPINKPPAELLGLSLVTGICIAESMAELASVFVQLKWPNDVLVDGHKLCGLLTELVAHPAGVTQVCVGVGINYNQPSKVEGSDYTAVSLPSLSSSAPSREAIIADVASRLLEAYAVFAEKGWQVFADRWQQFDYLCGQQVRIINAGKEEHAIAVGVDSNGALLVERDGKTNVVYSGDVSVRLV